MEALGKCGSADRNIRVTKRVAEGGAQICYKVVSIFSQLQAK